jgi:hypothetical protein
MQDYEDDLSWVLAELAAVFTQSLGVFAQSSDLLAQSTIFLEKSVDVIVNRRVDIISRMCTW